MTKAFIDGRMNTDANRSAQEFSQFLKEQTELARALGALRERLVRGEALTIREQQLLFLVANAAQGGFVGQEFQARMGRFTSLGRHFTDMICLAAFNNLGVADLLETATSTGRREKGWVLAADIRNSTELMRQARSASEFAEFLSNIASWMKMSLTYPAGYFDKFTGDGCLAFFPDTLTEGQGELFALDAAVGCHSDFQKVLSAYKASFHSIPDTGLGVGVEYGEVEFVEIAHAKTIVGEPVVKAFRLSSCPSHRTHLTEESAARVLQRYPQLASGFIKTTQDLKSYGKDQMVMRWKDDLATYAGIELRTPTWLQQVYPESKIINKTRLPSFGLPSIP